MIHFAQPAASFIKNWVFGAFYIILKLSLKYILSSNLIARLLPINVPNHSISPPIWEQFRYYQVLSTHAAYLSAPFVDPRCFLIIYPGVVKHEPHVIHIIPRCAVLSLIQLLLNSGQIHWVLYDVKVVLIKKCS